MFSKVLPISYGKRNRIIIFRMFEKNDSDHRQTAHFCLRNMDSTCSVCGYFTKYRCINCKVFVCNKSLNCSLPVDEEYPGWEAYHQVALCTNCDAVEFKSNEDVIVVDESSRHDSPVYEGETTQKLNERDFTEENCASRGYHAYRKVWQRPSLNQNLAIKREHKNLHDPYAMGVYAKISGKIIDETLVGHIPREISRFCCYFVRYGGAFTARVRQTKFRRSPLPQGGLEIPISLRIWQADSSNSVYEKMKKFFKEYYLEPEDILVEKITDETDM